MAMSNSQNVHLVIRNTRPDDIEKIVKLQQESFPILARSGNILSLSSLAAFSAMAGASFRTANLSNCAGAYISASSSGN